MAKSDSQLRRPAPPATSGGDPADAPDGSRAAGISEISVGVASGSVPKATVPMPQPAKTMIGIWIVALSSIALAHLPWAWALAERFGGSNAGPRARWLGLRFAPQRASILLVVVVLTAVIGSCATLALTFAARAGYDNLEKGWGWWYFTRPFTASGIAVLAYALLQGGFLGSGSATTPDLLAAGAIGALAGLFTDQLLQKMRAAMGLSAFSKSAAHADEQKKTNLS
jgi:hypothetical protein